MSKVKEFEENARQALSNARVTADVGIRAHWLKLADHWLELAQAEKLEASAQEPSPANTSQPMN